MCYTYSGSFPYTISSKNLDIREQLTELYEPKTTQGTNLSVSVHIWCFMVTGITCNGSRLIRKMSCRVMYTKLPRGRQMGCIMLGEWIFST